MSQGSTLTFWFREFCSDRYFSLTSGYEFQRRSRSSLDFSDVHTRCLRFPIFVGVKMFAVKLWSGGRYMFHYSKKKQIFGKNKVTQMKRGRNSEAIKYKPDFFSDMVAKMAPVIFELQIYLGRRKCPRNFWSNLFARRVWPFVYQFDLMDLPQLQNSPYSMEALHRGGTKGRRRDAAKWSVDGHWTGTGCRVVRPGPLVAQPFHHVDIALGNHKVEQRLSFVKPHSCLQVIKPNIELRPISKINLFNGWFPCRRRMMIVWKRLDPLPTANRCDIFVRTPSQLSWFSGAEHQATTSTRTCRLRSCLINWFRGCPSRWHLQVHK